MSYKFYGRNLQRFVINYSVCPLQSFLMIAGKGRSFPQSGAPNTCFTQVGSGHTQNIRRQGHIIADYLRSLVTAVKSFITSLKFQSEVFVQKFRERKMSFSGYVNFDEVDIQKLLKNFILFFILMLSMSYYQKNHNILGQFIIKYYKTII